MRRELSAAALVTLLGGLAATVYVYRAELAHLLAVLVLAGVGLRVLRSRYPVVRRGRTLLELAAAGLGAWLLARRARS